MPSQERQAQDAAQNERAVALREAEDLARTPEQRLRDVLRLSTALLRLAAAPRR